MTAPSPFLTRVCSATIQEEDVQVPPSAASPTNSAPTNSAPMDPEPTPALSHVEFQSFKTRLGVTLEACRCHMITQMDVQLQNTRDAAGESIKKNVETLGLKFQAVIEELHQENLKVDIQLDDKLRKLAQNVKVSMSNLSHQAESRMDEKVAAATRRQGLQFKEFVMKCLAHGFEAQAHASQEQKQLVDDMHINVMSTGKILHTVASRVDMIAKTQDAQQHQKMSQEMAQRVSACEASMQRMISIQEDSETRFATQLKSMEARIVNTNMMNKKLSAENQALRSRLSCQAPSRVLPLVLPSSQDTLPLHRSLQSSSRSSPSSESSPSSNSTQRSPIRVSLGPLPPLPPPMFKPSATLFATPPVGSSEPRITDAHRAKYDAILAGRGKAGKQKMLRSNPYPTALEWVLLNSARKSRPLVDDDPDINYD